MNAVLKDGWKLLRNKNLSHCFEKMRNNMREKVSRLFRNNTCYFIGVVLRWLGTASIRYHVDKLKILNKFWSEDLRSRRQLLVCFVVHFKFPSLNPFLRYCSVLNPQQTVQPLEVSVYAYLTCSYCKESKWWDFSFEEIWGTELGRPSSRLGFSNHLLLFIVLFGIWQIDVSFSCVCPVVDMNFVITLSK